MKRLLKTQIFRAARANLDKKTVIVINKFDAFFCSPQAKILGDKSYISENKINTDDHSFKGRGHLSTGLTC